jgi:hypothetical protein
MPSPPNNNCTATCGITPPQRIYAAMPDTSFCRLALFCHRLRLLYSPNDPNEGSSRSKPICQTRPRGQGRPGSQARLLLPCGAGARSLGSGRRGQGLQAARHTLFGGVRAGEATRQESGIEGSVTNGASWRADAWLSVRWVGLQGLYGASHSDLAHAAASVLALM